MKKTRQGIIHPQRSAIMRAVKRKNTGPEMVLRSALHRRGFRFRTQDQRLPGSPDLVLPKFHAVVFVHGCFWHRHDGCRLTTTPKTRVDFWREKFRRNVERDRENVEALLSDKWRTAVVWQCQLSAKALEATVDSLADWLKGTEEYFELAN